MTQSKSETDGGYIAPQGLVERVVLEQDYEAMRKDRDFWRALWCVLAVMCFVAMLTGCAAGKSATGGVVVGFDVASLPETAGEVVGKASEFLPEPWRSLALGGVTLLGGGGLLGYAKKKGQDEGWKDRDEHQSKIDATYDEGVRVAKGGL